MRLKLPDFLSGNRRKPVVDSPPPVAAAPDPVAPDPAPPAAPGRLDRLNRWLTLGANIAVLAGLIMLIVEVHQNAALTRTAMEQQKNDLLAQIEFSIAKREMADVWVKSIRTPEALTDTEARMVESHLVALMLQWDQMLQMEEAGLVSRDHARQHIQNSAAYYFGSRFAKHWWKLQEQGWDGTPMMEIAGPIVGGLDENFLANNLDRLKLPPPEPDPAP
jgi:hypothetical protein